jgi:hypothetical protein
MLEEKDQHLRSPLAIADKFAIYLTPTWLYIPMVRLTGELDEYRSHHDQPAMTDAEWHRDIGRRCAAWAFEEYAKQLREDAYEARRFYESVDKE